jgi:hypothetical protein
VIMVVTHIMPIAVMVVTVPIAMFPFPAPTPIIPGAISAGMMAPTPPPIVPGAMLSISQIGQARDKHECKQPSESSHESPMELTLVRTT